MKDPVDLNKEIGSLISEELYKVVKSIEQINQNFNSFVNIERLDGLTNMNFRLTADEKTDYVLRIPGVGTSEYIDRHAEKHNAAVVEKAGIINPYIFFDETTGVALNRYINNGITLHPEMIPTDRYITRVAELLRHLHNIKDNFNCVFDIFGGMQNYDTILKKSTIKLPPEYDLMLENTMNLQSILVHNQIGCVPCHNDPLCENFIDDGQRLYLIDWEYSGMNDPMWDIGAFSIEAGLDKSLEELLLREYFGFDINDTDYGKMLIYKALCDAYWTLWAIVQIVYNKPYDEYWPYAMRRYNRYLQLVESTEFKSHMQILQINNKLVV